MPLCRDEDGSTLTPDGARLSVRSGAARGRWRADDYAHKIYGRPSDDAVAQASPRSRRRAAASRQALARTLSRPGITAPIFGATRVEHVDTAVKTLEMRLEAADIADRRRLRAAPRAEVIDQQVGGRGRLDQHRMAQPRQDPGVSP